MAGTLANMEAFERRARLQVSTLQSELTEERRNSDDALMLRISLDQSRQQLDTFSSEFSRYREAEAFMFRECRRECEAAQQYKAMVDVAKTSYQGSMMNMDGQIHELRKQLHDAETRAQSALHDAGREKAKAADQALHEKSQGRTRGHQAGIGADG